jgi:hypothetical protein
MMGFVMPFSKGGGAAVRRRRREASVEVAALEPRTVMSQLGFIGVSANPNVLWPPNGRVVPTVVTVSGSESGSPAGTLPGDTTLVYSVTDSEGQLTQGAQVVPPSQVVDRGGQLSFVVPLVSSRAGQDRSGRHYVITVTAVNPTLNKPVGTAFTVVTVPHDMGHGFRPYRGGGPFYGGAGSNLGRGGRYEAILLARQERLEARGNLFGNRPFRQFRNQGSGIQENRPLPKPHGRGNVKIPPGHIYAVTIVPNYVAVGNDQGPGNSHGHGNGNGNGHGHGNGNGNGHGQGNGNGHGHGHG